jgi:hypothetical protein
LKITAAKSLVLEILQKKAIDQYNLYQLVDLYLYIGGKKSILLPLLESTSYEEPVFDHLLQTLADAYPREATTVGLAAIASGHLSKEEELRIARLLTATGIIPRVSVTRSIFSAMNSTFPCGHKPA